MRATTALWAVCLCSYAAISDAEQFPYTATLREDALAYAEAGEQHAPATQLAAGASLEVYRRDGEWLAVRPPQGSFSWVQAADIEETGQANVVRVTKPGATSYVGHDGSDQRTCWQIQLKQGELLHALEENTQLSPAPLWRKIAPPSGEFRYVNAKHMEANAFTAPSASASAAESSEWTKRSKAAEASSSASASPSIDLASATVMPLSAVDPVTARLNQIEQQLTTMLAQPANTWNTLPLSAELHTLSATGPTPELRARSQQLWAKVYRCQQIQQGYASVATPASPANYSNATYYNAGAMPNAVQRPQGVLARFRQLAAGQPAAYNGQPQPMTMHQPAAQLMAQPAMQQPVMQQPVVAPAIYQQPITNAAAPQPQPAPTPTVTTASYAVGTGVAAPASYVAPASYTAPVAPAPQPYAATGWLMPLVSRSQMPRDSRSGVPPYAITDDAGNVLALVTPAPGLSVTEYLRQQVGVIGPVNQLPNLGNPHVVAQRVVVLSRHE